MVLKAIALTKVFGKEDNEVTALDNATISIKPGEFIAIMGPSGSGKSTLLHLLGGLDRPTSGHVFLDEADITTLKEDELAILRRQRIGFIFQSYNLIAVLSAEENVALPLLMDGRPNEEIVSRVEKVLGLVGLQERRQHRPSQLSGGEQQRVAIARALANRPDIILADEPTGNLDSTHAEDIMNLLRDVHSESGCAIAMVTHDPKMAAFADRIVFLKDGKIIDEEQLGGKIDTGQMLEGLKR